MKIIKKTEELKRLVFILKNENKTIGFVPTMGALHKGHISLLEKSKEQCDITIVSIFVNPTQFNDKTDLEKYPRTLKEDLAKLEHVNCDIVFTPDSKEMYPKEDTRIFDFGNIDKVMEGVNRPGHFNGVGLIVSKLFEIVTPNFAFFGKKDFQQVAIINSLVKQLKLDVNIVACPIIRENSGLAMSSRNERLNKDDRREAAFINDVLKATIEQSKIKTVKEVVRFVENEFKRNSNFKLEYFEIVEDLSLENINNWNDTRNKTGCIVAHIGGVRLIDNIQY